MNFFGKYFFIRLLTAAIFGLTFAYCVRVYHLFDFGFAAEIGFVFVLLGFMFLSQKYTLFMQVIALLCALYVGYRLQTAPIIVPEHSAEYFRARTLFLEVIRYKQEGAKSLHGATQQSLQFCLQSDCPKFLQEAGAANFWFFEAPPNTSDITHALTDVECKPENTACQSQLQSSKLAKENLKPSEIWCVNDHLQMFSWDQKQLTSINLQGLSPNEGKGKL